MDFSDAVNHKKSPDAVPSQKHLTEELKERQAKLAGMRVFATVLLDAWRKRRNEVKTLTEEVQDLKRSYVKAKKQLHVLNLMLCNEQKLNDELNNRFARALDELKVVKFGFADLTAKLIHINKEKSALEQQLNNKNQEFSGLNLILSDTQSELFRATVAQRTLEANISTEQSKSKLLENEKNDLSSQVDNFKNELVKVKQKFNEQLKQRDAELEKARAEIKILEELHIDDKIKEYIVRGQVSAQEKLKNDIEKLQNELYRQQQNFDANMQNRFWYWCDPYLYQSSPVKFLHWVAHCMLPAIPFSFI